MSSEIRKAGYIEDTFPMRILWPVLGKKSKESEEVRLVFELLPFSETLWLKILNILQCHIFGSVPESHQVFFFFSFFLFFFSLRVYLERDRERESTDWGGAKEEERDSQADSLLSLEPNDGLTLRALKS